MICLDHYEWPVNEFYQFLKEQIKKNHEKKDRANNPEAKKALLPILEKFKEVGSFKYTLNRYKISLFSTALFSAGVTSVLGFTPIIIGLMSMSAFTLTFLLHRTKDRLQKQALVELIEKKELIPEYCPWKRNFSRYFTCNNTAAEFKRNVKAGVEIEKNWAGYFDCARNSYLSNNVLAGRLAGRLILEADYQKRHTKKIGL